MKKMRVKINNTERSIRDVIIPSIIAFLFVVFPFLKPTIAKKVPLAKNEIILDKEDGIKIKFIMDKRIDINNSKSIKNKISL